jgi:hypothetical protein
MAFICPALPVPEGNQVPASIDFLGEQANSVEIGENDISSQAEKHVIKLVQVSCIPGYMKFHSGWFEIIHLSFCRSENNGITAVWQSKVSSVKIVPPENYPSLFIDRAISSAVHLLYR